MILIFHFYRGIVAAAVMMDTTALKTTINQDKVHKSITLIMLTDRL